jgi:hypothetical protein
MTDDPRWAIFTVARAYAASGQQWLVFVSVPTPFGTMLSGEATTELFDTREAAEAWVMATFEVDPRDWVRSETEDWIGPSSHAPGTWPAVPKGYLLVKLEDWNPERARRRRRLNRPEGENCPS